MFEIVKININTLEDNSDSIYIEFIPTQSDYNNIEIVLEEALFNTSSCKINMELILKGYKYWISLNTMGIHKVNNNSGQLTSKFNNGFNIKFYSEGNLIYVYNHNFIKTYFEKNNTILNKKTIWVIGDSHVAHLFKNLNNDDIIYGDFVFNHCSVVGLSLNRFLKSNYQDFFKTIPIKKQDVVCFLLGEIDLRKTIIKSSRKKQISSAFLTYTLLNSYIEFFYKFKENHKNTFILSPNGVVNDKQVIDNFSESFEVNSELERNKLWETFNNNIKNIIQNYYIDYTENIRDLNNIIQKDFLIENDHHLKSNKEYFEKIYKRIYESYIA